MSVLIKGMEMPESCEDCTFYTLRPVARCTLLGDIITSFDDDRLSDCPIVEVPTLHGRMIERRSRSVNVIYIYEFEDGTRIEMLNIGLSTQELWAMMDIHGDCKCSLIHEE